MLTTLPLFPPDPLFHLYQAFQKDPNPQKMNLGIGVFVTETGQPYVMPSVQEAVRMCPTDNFNYSPISGNPAFLRGTAELVLGEHIDPESFVVQATCGGTHACALFAALAKRAGYEDILIPDPTWVNHKNIFSAFSQTVFSHLDANGHPDVEAYRRQLLAVTRPTILLLHGGPTHNPTGKNLSLDQIRSLLDVIRSRPVCVFIDFAYLGLGDGVNEDVQSPRLLLRELDEVAVGVSFSKNATLYGHRTGALMVKTTQRERVESNLRQLVRSTISSAPLFGQNVMATLWQSSRDVWLRDVEDMRQRTDRRRQMLIERLPVLASLQTTRGLFGMLPLLETDIQRLREMYAIYIPSGGRINFSGIEPSKLDSLVQALSSCL